MRHFLSLAVVALCVAGCSTSGRIVVKSEPDSPPVVNPPLPHGNQGPVASVGIPPGHYPPAGMCRVWLPGTPPGHQPKPQLCEEASRDVPLGGWLVRAPKEGIVEVLAYDERDSDVVVMISWYDAKSGEVIAVDALESAPTPKGNGKGKGSGKGKSDKNDKK